MINGAEKDKEYGSLIREECEGSKEMWDNVFSKSLVEVMRPYAHTINQMYHRLQMLEYGTKGKEIQTSQEEEEKT